MGIAMGLAAAHWRCSPARPTRTRATRTTRSGTTPRFSAIAAPAVGVLAFLGYIVDDVAGDGVLLDEPLGFVASSWSPSR